MVVPHPAKEGNWGTATCQQRQRSRVVFCYENLWDDPDDASARMSRGLQRVGQQTLSVKAGLAGRDCPSRPGFRLRVKNNIRA